MILSATYTSQSELYINGLKVIKYWHGSTQKIFYRCPIPTYTNNLPFTYDNCIFSYYGNYFFGYKSIFIHKLECMKYYYEGALLRSLDEIPFIYCKCNNTFGSFMLCEWAFIKYVAVRV